MATLTIRNLDEALVKKLKAQAKASHRSLEAEARALLAKEVEEREARLRFYAEAKRIAALTPKGRRQTDSTLLIRKDRDR